MSAKNVLFEPECGQHVGGLGNDFRQGYNDMGNFVNVK